MFFVFARLFFLIVNFYLQKDISTSELLKSFIIGLRLDASFSSYICFFTFLAVLFSIWIPKKSTSILLKSYTTLVLFFISFFIIVDAFLYKSWGVRIDHTLLKYLNTPKAMLASISTKLWIVGITFWLGIFLLSNYAFKKLINKTIPQFTKAKNLYAFILLFFVALLLIPARGGFQEIPINQSNVYFSNHMFANHTATNCIWNFMHSLSSLGIDDKNPYVSFDDSAAKQISNNEINKLRKTKNQNLLNNLNPNIILLVWESLSSKVVGVLGGEQDVTTHFNQLSREGILFTNFYANGDRTDQGLISILSGYYPQPTKSIIKIPSKSKSLPMLTKVMKELGYDTSFDYGGDLNFGNMNTYFRNGNITNLKGGDRFNKKDWNSKWGVFDHIFLDSLANDLKSQSKTPFFKIALTLTSHEPFEIPTSYKFGKSNEEDLYRSSQAYTDESIGEFIAFAKKQPWWNSTLIIIVSDHGHWLPKHKGYFNSPEKFKIPMLWLGGALNKKDTIVSNIASQVDLSYTLLKTLNKDEKAKLFKWSKNIFNDSDSQFAQYIFNNGFGTVDKEGAFVYDFTGLRKVISEGKTSARLDSLGKALIQQTYQDFLDR